MRPRAHYNNSACLILLFKLSWKENILNIKKRDPVTNLPVPSSQSSVVSHCQSLTHFTRKRFFKKVYKEETKTNPKAADIVGNFHKEATLNSLTVHRYYATLYSPLNSFWVSLPVFKSLFCFVLTYSGFDFSPAESRFLQCLIGSKSISMHPP